MVVAPGRGGASPPGRAAQAGHGHGAVPGGGGGGFCSPPRQGSLHAERALPWPPGPASCGSSPPPSLPVSSRSLSCGAGWGGCSWPLPGWATCQGRRRECLHHVLWAASSGPRAGAASRGAWPPEAPPGAPQAGSAHCPGSGFRSPGSGSSGWQREALPPPALLWPFPGGSSLALPSPQPLRPVSQNPTQSHMAWPPLLPALPLTPCDLSLRSDLISWGQDAWRTLTGGPRPPSRSALLWTTSILVGPQRSNLCGALWGPPQGHSAPKWVVGIFHPILKRGVEPPPPLAFTLLRSGCPGAGISGLGESGRFCSLPCPLPLLCLLRNGTPFPSPYKEAFLAGGKREAQTLLGLDGPEGSGCPSPGFPTP